MNISSEKWRKRCLAELGKFIDEAEPSVNAPPHGRTNGPGEKMRAVKGSSRHEISGLLKWVIERSSILRSEVMSSVHAEQIAVVLRSPRSKGRKVGILEIRRCLPALHAGVGRFAILTRALDRLRDELKDCNDLEWLRMQTEFCFELNSRLSSSCSKFPARQLLKESAESHAERFSNTLGDFKKFGSAIRKNDEVSGEATWRMFTGLILSLQELNRDISIHLAVIGEWMKRSEQSRATIRYIFRSVPPSVTGDGLTENTAWEFPLARMQGEGVAMAHEFMEYKGPKYRLRQQGLVDIDNEKILEYWETDAGRFWFRYRRDPQIDDDEEF